MSGRMDKKAIARLRKLQRVAEMKSDMELRRFSAFRAHMSQLHGAIEDQKQLLQQEFSTDRPFSVAEAQLAAALAGAAARRITATEAEIARMTPKFEEARQKAMREFGRAQVIKTIGDDATRQAAGDRYKPSDR